MSYLNYHGSQIYYEIAGNGDPLLYLHGWNGSIKSFKDCLSHELKQECQLVMIDLPGFGKSGYFPLSFVAVSEIIEKILLLHDIDKVNLMGFCMGGAFALDFTIRSPHRVRLLVLVETSFQFPGIMYPLLIPKAGKSILRFFLFHPVGIRLIKHYLFMSDHQYRKEFYRQFQTVDPEISLAYAKTLFGYSDCKHQSRIKGIQAETKIVIGEHTRWSIRASAARLKKLIANSEIFRIKQTRHFPIEENSTSLLHNLLIWQRPQTQAQR